MKKSILFLGVSLFTAVAMSFAFLSNFKGIHIEAAKATAKEFTFNESVGSNQFETDSDVVNKSVVTGISSNIETEVSLQEYSEEQSKSFGDNGYFVRNGSSVTDPRFYFEIGANNITSVSVTYGLVSTSSTNANEVQCSIRVFEGNDRVDETGTSGTQLNQDLVLTWNKEAGDEFTVDSVRINVAAVNGFVFWGEPLYVKSITITWSC